MIRPHVQIHIILAVMKVLMETFTRKTSVFLSYSSMQFINFIDAAQKFIYILHTIRINAFIYLHL